MVKDGKVLRTPVERESIQMVIAAAAGKRMSKSKIKEERGGERNEVLYESSIIESRLANVYSEVPGTPTRVPVNSHEASMCKNETSSLESII